MRAILAILIACSHAAALQTQGRSALQLKGGSDEVVQQEQTNATRSDYVVKGTIGAAGTGALVWGAKATLNFLGRRRAAERRRARSLAVRARRFLRSGLAFTNSVKKRGRTVAARGTKLGARVCAPLYDCVGTYAARSCLATIKVAEFNNRTVYRACAFVTAPLAMKPATARSQLKAVLRQELRMRPSLLRDARKGKMPLDDACLERYLAAARWSLDFPDRPVVDAIGATAAWRASTVAARAPDSIRAEPEWRRFFWSAGVKTRRKEAVLVLHARHAVDAPLSHLIRVIEGGCRSTQRACVVLDARGAPSSSLFDVAKKMQKALPVFQAHYPGRLGRVVVLEGGRPAALIWGVLSKLCDDEAKARIAFVDSLDQLDALVSVAELNRCDAVFAETSRLASQAETTAHTLYL